MTLAVVGPCPLCGGAVQTVAATTTDRLYGGNRTVAAGPLVVARDTLVAACSGCELVVDLRTSGGVDKSSADLLAEVGRLVAEKGGAR